MPIRIVCPSCSAALSVKDEFAGRAVKCPKCGGVIPPSQPEPTVPAAAAPPPAPPPPAPPAEKPAFEEIDVPATPKGGSKITAKPVAKSMDSAGDEDDDRPRKKGRDRDEREEDDRPSKRRRRNEDNEDDDRPRGKKGEKKGGSGTTIVAILCGTLLLCCVGAGGVGYWFYVKAKQGVEELKKGTEEFVDKLDKMNARVTESNYNTLKVGTTTRAQAEATLGAGKAPTDAEIDEIFVWDKTTAASWKKNVAKNRALTWRNGDDYILVYLHPDAGADSRVQIKEWHPKNPPGSSRGSNDDAFFEANYPAKKGDDLNGPAVTVSAEDLAKAYKDDLTSADAKYKDRVVIVEGKLSDISMGFEGEVNALLEGNANGKPSKVRCVVQKSDVNRVFNTSRGQPITFRGKCVSLNAIFVDVMDCKVESQGPDPSVNVIATILVNDYVRNEAMADEKYKDKAVTISSGLVDSKTADSVTLIGSGKAKSNIKIKVTFSPDFKPQFANVKVGARIKVKGECSGLFENTVSLNRAWLVP